MGGLYVFKDFGHNGFKIKLDFDHFQSMISSSFLH